MFRRKGLWCRIDRAGGRNCANQQLLGLLLADDHGRGGFAEYSQRGGADLLHGRLLAAGQAGRLQKLLQKVFAVRRVPSLRAWISSDWAWSSSFWPDSSSDCCESSSACCESSSDCRVSSSFCRANSSARSCSARLRRLGPAGPAESLRQDAQEKAGAGEDPQGQDVVGSVDRERPIRRDEPVIGRQRREHGGQDPRPAAADARHQQHGRIERDKRRQRTEGVPQPPLQRGGHGHDHHRRAIANRLCRTTSSSRKCRAWRWVRPSARYAGGRRTAMASTTSASGHPHGNRPEGVAGVGRGRGFLLLQQRFFPGLHLGHHGPQLIHDLLAAAGEDLGLGGAESPTPSPTGSSSAIQPAWPRRVSGPAGAFPADWGCRV